MLPATDPKRSAHDVLTERQPAMHAHWADQARTPLTETDLRLLHDQGHDPHPEQSEHDSYPTATSTHGSQENSP